MTVSERRGVRKDTVYDSIRESILTGTLAPGERLIESRLAEEYGTSRTIIRDALLRLQAAHLVSPAPNRGLIVRALSDQDIQEIYELRLILEGYAAESAASRITSDEVQHLRTLQEEMKRLEMAGDSDRLEMVRSTTELNNQFHRVIQEASRNHRLQAVLGDIVDVPLVFRSFYWYSDSELVEARHDHEDIVRALEERDPAKARECMRSHIQRGLNTLLREMRKSDSSSSR